MPSSSTQMTHKAGTYGGRKYRAEQKKQEKELAAKEAAIQKEIKERNKPFKLSGDLGNYVPRMESMGPGASDAQQLVGDNPKIDEMGSMVHPRDNWQSYNPESRASQIRKGVTTMERPQGNYYMEIKSRMEAAEAKALEVPTAITGWEDDEDGWDVDDVADVLHNAPPEITEEGQNYGTQAQGVVGQGALDQFMNQDPGAMAQMDDMFADMAAMGVGNLPAANMDDIAEDLGDLGFQVDPDEAYMEGMTPAERATFLRQRAAAGGMASVDELGEGMEGLLKREYDSDDEFADNLDKVAKFEETPFRDKYGPRKRVKFRPASEDYIQNYFETKTHIRDAKHGSSTWHQIERNKEAIRMSAELRGMDMSKPEGEKQIGMPYITGLSTGGGAPIQSFEKSEEHKYARKKPTKKNPLGDFKLDKLGNKIIDPQHKKKMGELKWDLRKGMPAKDIAGGTRSKMKPVQEIQTHTGETIHKRTYEEDYEGETLMKRYKTRDYLGKDDYNKKHFSEGRFDPIETTNHEMDKGDTIKVPATYGVEYKGMERDGRERDFDPYAGYARAKKPLSALATKARESDKQAARYAARKRDPTHKDYDPEWRPASEKFTASGYGYGTHSAEWDDKRPKGADLMTRGGHGMMAPTIVSPEVMFPSGQPQGYEDEIAAMRGDMLEQSQMGLGMLSASQVRAPQAGPGTAPRGYIPIGYSGGPMLTGQALYNEYVADQKVVKKTKKKRAKKKAKAEAEEMIRANAPQEGTTLWKKAMQKKKKK